VTETTELTTAAARPLEPVGRWFGTIGRDVASGASVAWKHVAHAGWATGTAVRRAAVGSGEVMVDGSVAAARGAKTGAAWTVLQWRMERNARRRAASNGHDDEGKRGAAVSASHPEVRPKKAKRPTRPSADS
jgi:hypothetical protein